jgi:hypothetical protein
MSNSARQSRALSKRNYGVLANFRYALREFLPFSENAASAVDLRPQQYQALPSVWFDYFFNLKKWPKLTGN